MDLSLIENDPSIMKIAILGGGGYIGSKLCLEMSRRGHHVTCIARNIDSLSPSILNNCEILKFDIDSNHSNKDLFTHFNCPDIVIDSAWSNLDNYASELHIKKTLNSHWSVVKNLVLNGLKNLTILGTCWEYGFQNGRLDEELVTAPIVNYAIAKDLYRKKVFKLSDEMKIHLNWARIFYIYGFDQPSNTIFSQLLDAKNGTFNMSCGDRIRDYLHIDIVVEYICKISTSSIQIGLINICSGKSYELKDIVNNWIQRYNLNVKVNLCYYDYSEYEPLSFWGSDTKLKQFNIKGI